MTLCEHRWEIVQNKFQGLPAGVEARPVRWFVLYGDALDGDAELVDIIGKVLTPSLSYLKLCEAQTDLVYCSARPNPLGFHALAGR